MSFCSFNDKLPIDVLVKYEIKSENTGTNCYKKDLDHSIDAERYALILMKDLGLAPVV